METDEGEEFDENLDPIDRDSDFNFDDKIESIPTDDLQEDIDENQWDFEWEDESSSRTGTDDYPKDEMADYDEVDE